MLRYSIELQVNETDTKYWAKMWCSEKMQRKTGKAVWSLSKPIERTPLFMPQAISQSLADSFQIDDNTQHTALANLATIQEALPATLPPSKKDQTHAVERHAATTSSMSGAGPQSRLGMQDDQTPNNTPPRAMSSSTPSTLERFQPVSF